MKYINEYEYNSEVLKDNLTITLNKNNIITYTIDIILIILSISYMLLNKKYLVAIIILIILIILSILTYLKKQSIINKQINKFEEHVKTYKMNIIIDSNKNIIIYNHNKQLNIENIIKIKQTKKWILLTVTGGYNIMLKKDSFKEGTPNSCYEYLKNIIKNNK